MSPWLLVPVCLAALLLWTSNNAAQDASAIRYEPIFDIDGWSDQPPTVAGIIARYQRNAAEGEALARRWPESLQQLERAERERKIKDAPALRDRIVQNHDRAVASLRAESRDELYLAVALLLCALPFQWIMRRVWPHLKRLTGGANDWLQAPVDGTPSGPTARLVFRDGTSVSRTTVYTLASLSVLAPVIGVLLFFYVNAQPPGQSNILPLALSAVFCFSGLAAPFQLRWVSWINQAQRALDNEIEARRQAAIAFQDHATQSSAVLHAPSSKAGNLRHASPAPATAPDDDFQIDPPPPGAVS